MSPKVLVGLAHFEIRICWLSERYLWALSVMHITISLASNVTNELVAGWCITEWVKRLAGNEIELGIGIPTIKSRASNIPMTKGKRMLLCGLTDKDLHRICRSQYEHPGSAIGYWPRIVLGHVYIVLEPVGFARLMLRWQFYYEFISFDVPKEFGVPDEIRDMTRSLEMVET